MKINQDCTEIVGKPQEIVRSTYLDGSRNYWATAAEFRKLDRVDTHLA